MQRKKYIGEEQEENLIQQVVSKYIPYWPLFLLAIVLGVGAAYVKLRYTIPVYEATATLIIKDEKKGNEESKLRESLDQISSKKIVENEIEVLQSRKLMTNVVNPLALYAPIFEKGEINTLSAYRTSPISVKVPVPDSLTPTGPEEKIFIDYDPASQKVTVNNDQKYPLNTVVSTDYGRLIFEPNKNYAKTKSPHKQLFFTLISPRDLVPALLGNLKAEAASKLSSVVKLSYRDEVPLRAENILNQLIISYRQSEIDEKDGLAKSTLNFVDERLKLIASDLETIEKKVQQFKSANKAVDIGAQGQLYLQNKSANDQRLSEVNTKISILDDAESFVKDKANSNGIVPSTLGGDPMLTQMMDKLYSSQLEYENLKKSVGENNPNLIAIKDRIDKIKPNILQNIKSQQQALQSEKQNVLGASRKYDALLNAVPQKERELLDISREQQIKSNIYSFLLQKKEESEIAAASTVANNRIVDYAKAGSSPVSPNRMIIMLVSVFVFMGLCLTFITIRETMTGKVLYRSEVESRTSIPIIGEVAFDKTKQPIVIESGRRSFVAEEFRKLRISLSFLGIDSKHKKVLVTSSISGEGKSFIAANLAISVALTGKRVVLVDMDLNNPSIAKILDVSSGNGVTEYLNGELEVGEIIKEIVDHENLSFISSGKIPENPSELLSNGRAKDLINYLDKEFDMVIIDTSPIVLVTDGYLLTGLCDATLYVVRHKYTPKMLVKRIDENNHINPIHNPAIIFNGVKARGFFKNNYGYGYDYVYGNKQKANEHKSLVKS